MRGRVAYHIVADNNAFVDYIGVDKGHRKRGIGTALLTQVGMPMHLIVGSLRNAAYYAKRGFTPSLSCPYAPSVGETAIFAEKIAAAAGCPVTGPICKWSELSEDERRASLNLVQATEKMSRNAASRCLATTDPRMRYVLA